MIIWKLIYEDNNTSEYYETKKKLLKDLAHGINEDKDLNFKIQKIIVQTKWDLVFQLKIAQGDLAFSDR